MNMFSVGVELEKLRLCLRTEAKNAGECADKISDKSDQDLAHHWRLEGQIYLRIAMKVEHLIRKMSKGTE